MTTNRRRILLAVDGSQQSLEAVHYVSRCFPPQKTEIRLFNVLNKVPEFFYDLGKQPQFQKSVIEIRAWERTIRDSIENFMGEAHRILTEQGIPQEAITVEIREILRGTAKEIIAEAAKGYDGVVIGRFGLSKFKDLIIGSVASKLLSALTHLSLCVVGGRPETEKILLAVNESEGALRAVDYVAKMTAEVQREVTLLHVIRGFNILQQRDDFALDQDIEKIWLELTKHGIEPVFNEARNRLTKAGLEGARIRTKIIAGATSRAAAIVHEARSGGIGTIVLGRRGLSGTKEFLMGRVSNKVIQASKSEAVWVVS